MKVLTALAGLAGGLGLFIFGINFCSEGLQKIAATRLKKLVKVLTKNPLVGVVSGALITVGLQSSSAASALVVGFINAGLMNLAEALGVLLGSAVGASVTAQIIAFRITELALFLIFLGTILYLFSRRSRQRNLGRTVLGFGLLFYGMTIMSSAMAPFRDFPIIAQTMVKLEKYSFLEFGLAMLVTAIIQSSPAFLALLMSLASQNLVSIQAVIPFVLGAHLGGTITGLLSSMGAPGRDAKRAAVANFIFKLINGLIFLPFSQPLAVLIMRSATDISRQIANAHGTFSLIMMIGFLPFTMPMANLMKKIIPEKSIGLGEATLLESSLLEVPELAVDQAHRQTVKMGKIIEVEMLQRIPALIRYGDEETIDRINEVEEAIDSLYKQISRYVTNLGNNILSDELMEKSIQILYTANYLENIGDNMINIVKNARKIKDEELEFSNEGLKELELMERGIQEHFNLMMKAFETMEIEKARNIVKDFPRMQRLEKEMRYNHFDRMHCGNEKTKQTSAVHLDFLEALLRIDTHIVGIAQVVMGIV